MLLWEPSLLCFLYLFKLAMLFWWLDFFYFFFLNKPFEKQQRKGEVGEAKMLTLNPLIKARHTAISSPLVQHAEQNFWSVGKGSVWEGKVNRRRAKMVVCCTQGRCEDGLLIWKRVPRLWTKNSSLDSLSELEQCRWYCDYKWNCSNPSFWTALRCCHCSALWS